MLLMYCLCKVCAKFQHNFAEFVTRSVSKSRCVVLVQRNYPRASCISFDNYFSQQKGWIVPWAEKEFQKHILVNEWSIYMPITLSEKKEKFGSQKYLCKNFQNHCGFGVVWNHRGFIPNWIFAKKDYYQGCQGVDFHIQSGLAPNWIIIIQGCFKPFWFIALMAH